MSYQNICVCRWRLWYSILDLLSKPRYLLRTSSLLWVWLDYVWIVKESLLELLKCFERRRKTSGGDTSSSRVVLNVRREASLRGVTKFKQHEYRVGSRQLVASILKYIPVIFCDGSKNGLYNSSYNSNLKDSCHAETPLQPSIGPAPWRHVLSNIARPFPDGSYAPSFLPTPLLFLYGWYVTVSSSSDRACH